MASISPALVQLEDLSARNGLYIKNEQSKRDAKGDCNWSIRVWWRRDFFQLIERRVCVVDVGEVLEADLEAA